MTPIPGTIQYAIQAFQREMDAAFLEWLRKRMIKEECKNGKE